VLIDAKNFISDSFVINKGSESGLQIGNPVIKNNYLIGQITEVNQKHQEEYF
jgi:Cell shape-determining protein